MITFLRHLACRSLWSALPLVPACAAAAPARLNVVLILADDLGFGDLGCYGHRVFKTPNIDRLAAEGARMTQFNTPTPSCGPTRASLMTGRYPLRCGLPANPAPDGVNPQAREFGLPESEVILAQLFRSAGYATSLVGKWHLGHARPAFLPARRGFDEYFGMLYSNDMRPVTLYEGERPVEYPVVQATVMPRYTERALAFIERNKSRPFFLYYAPGSPHKPLVASERFYKKTGAGLYADTVAELDWSVGQVLDKLKALDLEPNTLVLFTSDNGPWYGGSTGGLRGMKSRSFEGGYRVPMIARWPGRIPAGHVTNELGIMMDLFATIVSAAGLRAPSDRVIDGRDILPLLTSDAKTPHEYILGSTGPTLACIRDSRWKLHVTKPGALTALKPGEPWTDPRGPDGVTILAPYEQTHPSEYPGLLTGDEPAPMMLFDLQTDPGEQRNIAAEHPEIITRLKQRFDTFQQELKTAQR